MKRYIKSDKDTRKVVTDWRELKVGDNLVMICDEFDGYSETPCSVIETFEDHAIAYEDCQVGRPQTLWIDNFNQDMFVYSSV